MYKIVGLMAAVAIAFLVFTSPESQPQASPHVAQESDVLEQSFREMTAAIVDLQDTVDRQQAEVDRQLEAKFVALHDGFTSVDDSLQDLVEELRANQEALEARVDELEAAQKAVAAKPATAAYPAASGVVTGGSSGSVAVTVAPAKVAVSSSYTPRWTNYDGLSKEEHARVYHGINTSGLSTAQIAMALDRDHDTYGGSHPPAMRSRTSVRQVSTPVYSSSCPGGVCPTNSRTTIVQSRGGLFGFGLLGRRR